MNSIDIEVIRTALDWLDRGHRVAVGLGGEHRAGLRRLTVDPHDAGAAVGGVAADDGADAADVLAQEVDEESSRLDLDVVDRAIHGHADGDMGHVSPV